jgi:hypothetical protein
VNVVGSGRREPGQVEFGFMGQRHDTTIGVSLRMVVIGLRVGVC